MLLIETNDKKFKLYSSFPHSYITLKCILNCKFDKKNCNGPIIMFVIETFIFGLNSHKCLG